MNTSMKGSYKNVYNDLWTFNTERSKRSNQYLFPTDTLVTLGIITEDHLKKKNKKQKTYVCPCPQTSCHKS